MLVGNPQEHPMKDDGIFLGYDKNIPLKNEGLGRLLAFLVSGWVRLPDRRLTIACPYWLVGDLKSLLEDHGVSSERYALLRTEEPWWIKLQWRLKAAERRIRPTVHRIRAWIRGESSPEGLDFRRLFAAKPWYLGFLTGLTLAAIAAMVLWIVIRFWLVLLLLAGVFAIYGLWRRITKKRRIHGGQVSPKREIRKQRRRTKRYAKQMQRLVDQINEQHVVRNWLIPTPFWPEVHRITHRKSIVCPDLVLQEYPLRFADAGSEPIYSRILHTLQEAQQLICYSQTVKSHQLVHGVGLASEQIEVIGHGRVELSEYLKLGKTTPDQAEQRQIALEHLRSYQRSFLLSNPYWNRFVWDRSSYVFYSSQARGQKNILSLLRAIEILRHRGEDPIRLVLTCERAAGSQIDLFVSEHQLDAWVLFAPGVSNQVLASFYCLASLAVNPTLFEGGFPFTFTEAYSVGTPSLLSDISMVREKLADGENETGRLQERMLFDPMNPLDLAEKIRWGVANRQELIALQRGLFEAFPTWEEVARRYSDSLRG
jgi:glycosyltransferase involved in cell wall biosynthesis